MALLLISLCVLGTPMSHAHHGIGACEPADHAVRPHLHLAGGHSHSHAHAAKHQHSHGPGGHAHGHTHTVRSKVIVSPIDDHDSDALYLTDWTSNFRCSPCSPPIDEFTCLSMPRLRELEGNDTSFVCVWRPPDDLTTRPLFMRYCSLLL